jgi:hypothetical protein
MTWPARTRRLAAMAVLALAAGGAGEAPVKVFLEAVDEDAVKGLEPAKVEAALREKLTRKKRVALVASQQDATVVLRVTECLGWTEKRRINEAQERPVNMPTQSGGIAGGTEGVYGARTERQSQVLLVVRATWGDHFQDLQSYDKDHSLKDAVDSVAGQMDALARRGLRPAQP